MDDEKIILAIFFVPMVRKLQLPVSEEFVTLLQKKWVERYPKSPFYLGDYDSISGGFRKKFLGLCFITTAVCQELGKRTTVRNSLPSAPSATAILRRSRTAKRSSTSTIISHRAS